MIDIRLRELDDYSESTRDQPSFRRESPNYFL